MRNAHPTSLIISCGLAVLLVGCTFVVQTPTPPPPTSADEPTLASPDKYKLELYATFDLPSDAGGPADDAFQMTFTNGEQGFPPGLYVTGGSGSDPRLFRLTGPDTIEVVHNGFHGSETLLFAQGDYGDGMLVTVPREQEIRRLLPDGTLTTFAKLGTAPFGPADMRYGADKLLYVTDFTGGNILQVMPDGSSTVFASVPLPPVDANTIVVGMKPLPPLNDVAFLVGIFTLSMEPTGLGALYEVSVDGLTVTESVGGLDGLQLVTQGPGGVWGEDLYVATSGTLSEDADGAVYVLGPDQTLTPFLTGIGAVHVAFDTEGILGGGMFVTEIDLSEEEKPSRIWHITPVE